MAWCQNQVFYRSKVNSAVQDWERARIQWLREASKAMKDEQMEQQARRQVAHSHTKTHSFWTEIDSSELVGQTTRWGRCFEISVAICDIEQINKYVVTPNSKLSFQKSPANYRFLQENVRFNVCHFLSEFYLIAPAYPGVQSEALSQIHTHENSILVVHNQSVRS